MSASPETEFLQIGGRVLQHWQALIWPVSTGWVSRCSEWGWSCLFPAWTHCWNGRPYFTLQSHRCPILQPPCPDLIPHSAVRNSGLPRWQTYATGTWDPSTGLFAKTSPPDSSSKPQLAALHTDYSQYLTFLKGLQFAQAMHREASKPPCSNSPQISLALPSPFAHFPKIWLWDRRKWCLYYLESIVFWTCRAKLISPVSS